MTDAYAADKARLWNWGRWARINPDAPDGSCANPMYDFMIEREEGWGTYADAPIRVPGVEPGADIPAINDHDAEVMDGWIKQIVGLHRQNLVRRYVLRTDVQRECVDAAIRAIWDAQEANWRARCEMRRVLRA